MDYKLVLIKVTLILSALIGGILCVFADLIQKTDASAILLIGSKLEKIFQVNSPELLTIIIILLIASSLPLIFESKTKRGAFYAGGSVLAILMTITPYNVPPELKKTPNSVEINLSISTEDGALNDNVIVTIKSGPTIVGRSRMSGSQLRFYLDDGSYNLIVELPGYMTETRSLSVKEGNSPQSIFIKLKKSSKPLFIQRVLRN